MIDRIPDSDRLYVLKRGMDIPPVDVDRAHTRLIEQGFALAANAELLNDGGGALRITFLPSLDIVSSNHILYAWVVNDTIVRIGKSEHVFYRRFGRSVKGAEERFVTRAIRSWPRHYRKDKKDCPEEAQLWVTLFRRAGGHGAVYAKSSEFVPSSTGKKLVCPEELCLLKRHHPALNRSDQ